MPEHNLGPCAVHVLTAPYLIICDCACFTTHSTAAALLCCLRVSAGPVSTHCLNLFLQGEEEEDEWEEVDLLTVEEVGKEEVSG